MDELFQPIRTKLPSGLTVTTVRTERKGLLGGELRVGFGSAHALKIDPRWQGLPHFIEHLILFGASRNYKELVVNSVMEDKFHVIHNAWTGHSATCYFTNRKEGHVMPTRLFWDGLAAATDGLFFPTFDRKSRDRELLRILNEMNDTQTQSVKDNAQFIKLMFGLDYLNKAVIGTREQVESYTLDDFIACHQRGYNLNNTFLTVAGDVTHEEAIQRASQILDGAPSTPPHLPELGSARIHPGEFRRQTDGANQGNVEAELNFDIVSRKDDKFEASLIAAKGLNAIISDELTQRFGLYTAGVGYKGDATLQSLTLTLKTSEKEKAADAVAYALELMHSQDTFDKIALKRPTLIEGVATEFEVDQPTVQQIATALNSELVSGAPLRSQAERVERYRAVSAENVAQVLMELRTAPMFMNIRGHHASLDVIPPLDIVDAWRATPNSASERTTITRAAEFPHR